MIEPHPQGAPTTPNEGCGFRTRTMELGIGASRLVLDQLEFVPVGIVEPEDRAPIFLLRRLRDLPALLRESGLFPRVVGRVEHVSRVTLLVSAISSLIPTETTR